MLLRSFPRVFLELLRIRKFGRDSRESGQAGPQWMIFFESVQNDEISKEFLKKMKGIFFSTKQFKKVAINFQLVAETSESESAIN